MNSQRKNESVKIAFSERLKKAMDDQEIPERQRATELVKAAKITDQGARKWLNGQSMPGKANMHALAKRLKVREEWLEYGEGLMPARGPAQDEVEEALEAMRERLQGGDEARRRRLLDALRLLSE